MALKCVDCGVNDVRPDSMLMCQECKDKQTMELLVMDLKKKVEKENEALEKKKTAGWYSLSVAVSMLRDSGVDSHEIQKKFREIVHILYEL